MLLITPRLFLFSVIICFFLLVGCDGSSSSNLSVTPQLSPQSNPVSSLSAPEQSSQSQGIQGEVLQRTGNQMPVVDGSKERSNPQAVQTTVWVFPASIPAPAPRIKLSEIQSQFRAIAKTKTDRNGKFTIKLPPGEYTVFAQYGEDLYLNSFAGDGTYATVTVTANQTSQVRLVNTEKATF